MAFIEKEAQEQVAALFIAYLGRAPEYKAMEFYLNQLEAYYNANGGNMDEAALQLSAEIYHNAVGAGEVPGRVSSEEFVNWTYQNVLGRPADAEGLAYYVGLLDSGELARENLIQIFVENALGQEEGRDYQYMQNRIDVAVDFAKWQNSNPNVLGDLVYDSKEVLEGVNETEASVESALEKIAINAEGEAPVVATDLTVGQDKLVGSSANDTFEALVVQNAQGFQTNTLGSGDSIDGGAGYDTLNAQITAGVGLGDTVTMPIQPRTKSVEEINLEAVNNAITGANTQVYVNAKDLLGVEEISSNRSDADLIIQNLTTKDNAGVARELSTMTVGMKYTGNSDTRWDAADLNVYFDQDYLLPSLTSTDASVEMQLMNEDAYDFTSGAQPLAGVYVARMGFTLNGEYFDLAPYLGEDPEGAGTEIVTYADLLAAVEVAIVALKADHPENAALQSLSASLGSPFQADIDPKTDLPREGESIRLSVEGITDGQQNELTVSKNDLTLNRAEAATIENNNRYERAENDPADPGQRLAINVDLEKVGLAGDGGQLVIGSMFKDSANVWSDLYAGKGIEEFDVTVYGGDDKPSSLAGLHSTGNNLRAVTVTTDANQTGSFADLVIGNSNTAGYEEADAPWLVAGPVGLTKANALKDVQTFDASGFKGDLTLHAALTSEIGDKYLNLVDDVDNYEDDLETFAYVGGSGDDTISLALDVTNLAIAGTATRDDFALVVDGGAGDDELLVSLYNWDNTLANGNGQAWFDNALLNHDTQYADNLFISGGAGDDVVRTEGSGVWNVNLGTGNDAYFADNSGEGAVWVFNTADQADVAARDIDDLLSGANTSFGPLFKSTLVVNYRGIEVELQLGATINNALGINQAIKNAINNDVILSKLLLAVDGPANSLLVGAKVDGSVDADDLTVSVRPAVALTQDDYTQFRAANRGSSIDIDSLADLQAAVDAAAAAFNGNAGYDSAFATQDGADLAGENSSHISYNDVWVNVDGSDLIVLSTGTSEEDTITLTSTDDGGWLTIVNFEVGVDQLNYTAGNGQTYVYGSSLNLKIDVDNRENVGTGNDALWWREDATKDEWVKVTDIDFADEAAPGPGPGPEPEQTEVIVADLQTYNAADGAYKFVIDFTTGSGAQFANIDGFGDDDTIEIIGTLPSGISQLLDSSSANSLELVVGDLTGYTNAWALTLGQVDPALVTDVRDVGNGTPAGFEDRAAVLDAAWGSDWFIA